ncbi:chondroitin AC/alginate lyase [Russula earlei]|uniref:Chondroitin AC/alginate lyase n=1 Tax=Russula earlei TaxID=71964 RepID=A0ACC0UPN3_9AGAM|nr:chondroitin AC/alginate lyase [Russula earlei]
MASYNALDSHSPSPYGFTPYGSGDPYYHSSTGYIAPANNAKKYSSPWIKFGVPVGILVVAGAILAAVLATRHNHSASASASSGSSSSGSPAAASSAIGAKNAVGIFPTATDSEFMVPIYPSTTNAAAFSTPTFNPSDVALAWPADPFSPSNPDRPRLIAPQYKWDVLSNRIANDPYLKYWNDTIFGNATAYYSLPVVAYFMDGGSGILDNAREVKMRIKAFAYVARMTNDTKWVDRAWAEIQNAAGNGTTAFGPATDKWNSAHFLDTAEFSAAYGIAYDWLYDFWTPAQKSQMLFTLNLYGLQPGLSVYQAGSTFGWWSNGTYGNWNCVCNGGLTMAALAILGDDTTGNAAALLGYTINNAKQNCAQTVTPDGTNLETANYWYFATTGHAEMASSLVAAAGSDFGLFTVNQNFSLTGLYHMYVHGSTTLFEYGDHGPNKYSTTANAMFLYASQYDMPQYSLFQRDQVDAADPWSMFWYDPTISGAFWNGLPLDHAFNNNVDQWVSMRSSWTDVSALYVAMKAGTLMGHLTHGDLDCGDFVLDALGTRFAGELGSGDYNAPGYFAAETQNSTRWLYYRKRTEGQNTILVNQQNQLVTAQPTMTFGSSGTTQGSSTVFNAPVNSTAFAVFDLTSAYSAVTSFLRGVRLLNGRRQVLIQDEINATGTVMWRMHTNATIALGANSQSATLTRDGQTMIVTLLNAPSGAQFAVSNAVRLAGDPPLPANATDQPNPGVSVLSISLPAGQYSLQVLFNPQWPGLASSSYVTPPSVPLSSWSLTSHD